MSIYALLKSRVVLAASLLCLSLVGARAEVFLVDWSGSFLDHPTSAQKLSLGPEEPLVDKEGALIGVGYPYSDEVSKMPDNSHYLRTRPSALVYGVLQFTNPLAASADDFPKKVRPMNQLAALQGQNAITLGNPGLGVGSMAGIKGLFFWKKSDFQNGYSEIKNLTWASIVSIAAQITRISDGRMGKDPVVRFAILNAGTWYLTETSGQSGLFTVNDPLWGKWSEEKIPLPIPATPASYTVKGKELTNITAIGIYFDVESHDEKLNAVIAMNMFQVTANQPAKK